MLALLQLIYDLQADVPLADILVYPRKDTKIRDSGAFDFLQGKFTLIKGRSRRILSGWPHGPNGLAMDVFRLTWDAYQAGQFPYQAVLLMEADCVPLRPSWIRELAEEWSSQSKLLLGHWDGSGTTLRPPISHLNGNLLFHPRIVEHVPKLAAPDVPNGGWDMAFWPQLAPYATPSRLIYNDYRLNTKNNPLLTPDRLFQPRYHRHPENPLVGEELHPCWLHGTKDFRAIAMVRERFGLPRDTKSK